MALLRVGAAAAQGEAISIQELKRAVAKNHGILISKLDTESQNSKKVLYKIHLEPIFWI
jgi:hypothetical protein